MAQKKDFLVRNPHFNEMEAHAGNDTNVHPFQIDIYNLSNAGISSPLLPLYHCGCSIKPNEA